jgi:DNA replication protein DnaC
MTFSAFKDRVIQFRKEIIEFKSGHKMLDVAISNGIDCLPDPFKQFAKIFWDGLDKDDKSAEKLLHLLEKIEKSNEQSFNKIEGMISELFESGAKRSDIVNIADLIRTSNESVVDILNLISDKVNLLIEQSQAGSGKKQVDIEYLARYYHINSSNIVSIRDSDLDELEKYIENWDWQNREGKPILLITGDPGSGKSWLAYRLIYKFIKEHRYKIFKVTGTDVTNSLLINSKEEYDLKYKEKAIFILDDWGVSIEEINAPLEPKDVFEIIRKMTETGQKFTGPLIISMRDETWNQIIGLVPHGGKRFEKSKLDSLVKRKQLFPLKYNDSMRLVESFFNTVDGNSPPFPNLKASKEIKKMIAEKSKSNPIIIKLFFEQIDSESNGNIHEITVCDTNSIIGSAKFYCLKQIFYYYLPDIYDKCETNVSNILAFLYFLVKEGSISIGHLKGIKENDKNYLSEQILKEIGLLNHKKPLPLFNVDAYGLIMPFHDSVREAILNLVEQPHKLIDPSRIWSKESKRPNSEY